MKPYLIVGLCFFLTLQMQGQEFAFAPSPFNKANSTLVVGYKKAVAQRVFEDLLRAQGDFRRQKPTLVINKEDGYIASFNPDLVQVVLDEKAYDLCSSFGKDSLNALASLLAHELIHYYEEHDWNRNFAKENAGLETTQQLERLQEGLKQETQADYNGGFLAFSVGYNTYGIMPQLLKKAYKAYDLPEDLPGYPSLTERLKMVDGAMEKLRDLQIVYETANLLTILGNYADAAMYHRYILQSYQSREVYNNSGVNAALAAIGLFEPTELPYVLPLELDPKSRLFSIKNNDEEKENRKNALLNSALEQFDRALVLDENYATGYLNKACVLALKGAWEDAEYVIRKGKKKSADAQIASDFVVLEGIMAALQKDSVGAIKYWEQAKAQGNNWAKMNLEIFQHQLKPLSATNTPVKGLEEIEQFPIADFFTGSDQTPPDRQVKLAEKVFCGIRQFPNSRLFIHFVNPGKTYALIQETQPGYTFGKTQRGITLGDGEEKVSAAYGRAPRTLAMPNGSIWVYPESNLFFRFSPQLKVQSWGVYRKRSMESTSP